MSFISNAWKDLTGGSQESAARNAAQLQSDSANKAADNTLAMYNQTRSDLQPYNQSGLNANWQLQQGINDGSLTAGYTDPYGQKIAQGINDGSLTRAFNLNDFQADPSYAFRKQQGMDGIQSSAAARGGLLSGATLKALDTYNNNLASQEYDNAAKRFTQNQQQQYNMLAGQQAQGANIYNTNQQNRYNRLLGVTTLGQNSAAQTGAQGAAATAQANDFRTSGAAAQGAGLIGASNASAQGLNNLIKTGTSILGAFI